MRKSARVLGQECGLTDQEMNFVLKEEGFLDGEPGNYTVTEKSEKFAGDGKTSYGYLNGNWTTRTWDDGIVDELDLTADRKKEIRRSIKIARQKARKSKAEGLAIESDSFDNEDADTTDAANDALVELVSTLLVAVSAYGIYKAIPYVKRWWSEKAVPGLKKTKNPATGNSGSSEQ